MSTADDPARRDVLVCVKRTPAVGARITLTEDRMAIDTRHLGFTVGPHEECAVEAAVRIAEEHRAGGGTARVTVLTVGPPDAAEQLRYTLAMGADDGVLVEVPTEELAPEPTAASITAAVRAAADGGTRYDLLLFGTDSAVAGNAQAGIRVARALGLPMVTGIKGMEIDGEGVVLHRETPGGNEVYRVPLPAAVGVKEGINLPRYPTIKGRMRARKAELRTVPGRTEPGGLRTVGLRCPREDRPETVVLGTGAAAVPAVVEKLTELGVL
ncbi:electron transfer flavoprotein beta subunit/FixA family protein [Pseudonocardia sp. C8]|uniref:electron transfer flavoprotein subunit beta/FixA family protein n=1 Tax=Pseudonocardia sp. C8 TaxID=2762759 RepID=UPI001642A2B3|nr:electron transfer flavoprotein beta subunit/FixA family protein [Pseudonocardia sp. C8]MBC3194218.1 electron transfer flavoprotein beta subunit/FixA family protein [Pseudonocardia sp. C8]